MDMQRIAAAGDTTISALISSPPVSRAVCLNSIESPWTGLWIFSPALAMTYLLFSARIEASQPGSMAPGPHRRITQPDELWRNNPFTHSAE
jgi:hypothetical protein